MATAWLLTFLVIHLLSGVACWFLCKSAPCWMQKLATVGFLLAMAIFTVGYFILVMQEVAPELGWYGGWYFLILGSAIEHIALLLQIFRITYQRAPWPTHPLSQALSNQSHSLQK